MNTPGAKAVWAGRIMSGLVIAFLLFDGAIKLTPLDVVISTSRELGIPVEFARWSPFARDPKVNNHVGNPSSGTGARVDFDGSCAGTLSITGSKPSSKVAMRLQMTKPMKCDNRIEFSFVPQGGSTNVTWAMSGAQPYLGKLMNVFINCDKMVGKQFEQGLADLKKLAEQKAIQAAE